MANKNLTDLTARTATADSDLIHINSGGEDYKQAKSDFVSDLAQEVTFNTSSSLTSQVNAYSSARGAGYYFGKIASYGAQAVTGVPENDNYYVEFIVWDANNCKLTVSSTSVDKVFDQWKGGGTWSGTWQQRPRRSEITSLNSSLTNSLIVGTPYTDTVSLSTAGINAVDISIGNPPAISGYTFHYWIFVSTTYRFAPIGYGGTRLYYYVGTTSTNGGGIVGYPIYKKN